MKKRWLWIAVSGLVAATIIAVSCQPAAVEPEEEEPVAEKPVTEKPVTEKPATEKPVTEKPAALESVPVGELPPPPPGAKMVVNSVGKLMEEPRYGGTMNLSFTFGPWNGFDPIRWSSVDGTAWFLIGVYETLGLADYTKSIPGTGEWTSQPGEPTAWHWQVKLSNVTGNLAESWEMSSDLLTFTFHIRKGIRFQNKPPLNGREFTAADVKYVFDRHWGTGSGFDKPDSRYSAVFSIFPSAVESVECPDKYTMVIKWKDPNITRMLSLVGGNACHSGCFYPREILDNYGPTGLEDWRNIIGTGPFMLEDYVPDASFSFDKNPDYWRYDELLPNNKLPYVDKVNILIIPDASVNIAAFRVGKMDFGVGLFLSEEQIKELRDTNPYVYYTYYPMESNTIILPKLEVPPFNDVNVRRALQMAIDIDQYTTLYPGKRIERICRPIMPPLGKDWWVPFEQLPQDIQDIYTYNPEKARQLLAEAGYPSGFKTQVVAWPGDVVTPIVKSMWEKIGVDLEIKTVEAVAHGTMVWARSYDAMITWQAYWSYIGSGFWEHIPGYPAPTQDEHYIELASEFYDRRALLGDESQEFISMGQEAEQIILRDVYAFVVAPGRMSAQPHHPWVKNRWSYMPFDDHVLDLVARMWIDQDLRYQMIGKR